MLENTERAIKDGKTVETVNTAYIGRRKTKTQHNMC